MQSGISHFDTPDSMHKHLTQSLIGAITLLLVAAPVLLSIQIARHQSKQFYTRKAQALADEVIRRTDETGSQIRGAVRVLSVYADDNACSAQEIAVMRQLQISASYLQGVGRVRHNRLVCSSHGDHGAGIDLGPVDFVSDLGTSVRVNSHLPLAPRTPFVILESQGYAAIVHPALMFDVPEYSSEIALAIAASGGGERLVASRGTFTDAMFARIVRGDDGDGDGAIVARRRSKHFALSAIAVISADAVAAMTAQLKAWLMPVGLGGGLLLAWAFTFILRRQVSIPALLRGALRRDEFFVEYQPVVRLDNRQCVGAEALLRWRRQDGSMIRPDLFIPIAEESNLICAITRRMLGLVESDMPALLKAMPELHISVNLSPQDLSSADVVRQLSSMLARSGIDPRNLVVEATERGLIDVKLATTVIQEIRAAGIAVAIDDFGTGYSCLSYLTTLNVDYLKIDKSFVDTIGTAAPTNSVVPHIIAMARSLDLVMVAEGVETEAQAEFLRERGVQFAQGWLFAKPMPAADFQRFLTAQSASRPRLPAERGVNALCPA
jgi:sensor c-di-GMP phosphodiesterase-like protein